MVRISVLAALWMLVTACFLGSPLPLPSAVVPADPCGGKAPVVTRGTLGWTGETDPVILARRAIVRSDDRAESGTRNFPRHSLIDEIAQVLGTIRSVWPEMAEVNARPEWEPGTLILRLEPSLFEAVSAALPKEGVSAPLCTGHPEFDALNAAVGLRGVEILSFEYMSAIVISFDLREHVHSTSVSYGEIKGVIYARPDFVLGDGSDIEMLRSDGKWYAVFRKAWGDCPSGCIFSELHFFVEREGDVKRIDPERAADIEEFAQILAERGWMRRLEGR